MTSLSPAEQAVLDELELEVDDMRMDLQREAEALALKFHGEFRLQLSRLPRRIRNMPLKEFVQRYGGAVTHVLAEPSAQMQHELDEWVAQTPTLSCRKRSSSSSSRRSKLDGKTDDMHSVPESAASKGASGTGRKRKKSVRRPKPMKESHTEEGQEHTGSDASQPSTPRQSSKRKPSGRRGGAQLSGVSTRRVTRSQSLSGEEPLHNANANADNSLNIDSNLLQIGLGDRLELHIDGGAQSLQKSLKGLRGKERRKAGEELSSLQSEMRERMKEMEAQMNGLLELCGEESD